MKKKFMLMLLSFVFLFMLSGKDSIFSCKSYAATESYSLESPHPYTNSYTKTWTVTKNGSSKIRVRFAYYNVETNYDYVTTSAGDRFTGYNTNVWSKWSDGSKIDVTLTTDISEVFTGFKIDMIEYEISNIKIGVSAVSNYGTSGCSLANRVTDVYSSTFLGQITYDPWVGDPIATKSFYYLNTDAWEKDFKNNQSYTNVDDVDFMIFAGHGYRASYGNSTYNSGHFSTANGNTHPSGTEANVDTNFEYGEAYWGTENGNPSKTKWVTMYSCNFLNYETNLTKWGKTDWNILDGIHMLLGYATTMYIVGAEGEYYGSLLYNQNKVKDAFFTAAQRYQTANSEDVIARIIYPGSTENDTIATYGYRPVTFRNSNGGGYWIKSSYIESAKDNDTVFVDPRI